MFIESPLIPLAVSSLFVLYVKRYSYIIVIAAGAVFHVLQVTF